MRVLACLVNLIILPFLLPPIFIPDWMILCMHFWEKQQIFKSYLCKSFLTKRIMNKNYQNKHVVVATCAAAPITAILPTEFFFNGKIPLFRNKIELWAAIFLARVLDWELVTLCLREPFRGVSKMPTENIDLTIR